MTTLAPEAVTAPAPPFDDDDCIHIVDFWQSIWVDFILRRIPRALCGASLEGDPDRPEPGANAPICLACIAADWR